MLQITSSQRSRGSVSDPEEEEEGDLPSSQPGTSKAPPSKKTKKSGGSSMAVADTLREYLQRQDMEAQEVRAEVNILSFCKILEEHPLHAIVIH